MAVSLYHQGDNLDRERMRALTGQPASEPRRPRPPLHEWLLDWIDRDDDPAEELDSLPGVLAHLSDAWARRDASRTSCWCTTPTWPATSRLRCAAWRLGSASTCPTQRWPGLVAAAGFEAMRSRADRLAPDASGVLKDPARFFRRGSSGAGRELLSEDELARYKARVAGMAPGELVEWLHREDP